MKNCNLLRLLFSLTVIVLLAVSCEIEGLNSEGETLKATNVVTDLDCDAVIDFNELEAGMIVSELSSGNGISGAAIAGSISVYGENLSAGAPAENHAMIFDTDNPTGGDTDLVVAGADHKEVLIISEDLDSTDPDDNASPGGTFTFDFSGFGPGYIDIAAFTTIDNEEAGTWEAQDGGGGVISSGAIAAIADGTQQMIMVNATGVVTLIVTFNGSGALDDFCIHVEEEESGCTLTQGFWKNPRKGPFPEPYGRDDVFFLSGMTWQEVLTTAPAGNAYYQAAHQYIAAVLNIANGASTVEEVDNAITLGESLFNTYTPAEIAALQGDDPLRADFLTVNDVLDSYNNGYIGPGHCDD